MSDLINIEKVNIRPQESIAFILFLHSQHTEPVYKDIYISKKNVLGLMIKTDRLYPLARCIYATHLSPAE